MSKTKLLTKKKIFFSILLFVILDVGLIGFMYFAKKTSAIDLSFSTGFTDYYNYQPVEFNYIVVNKSWKNTPNNINVKLAKCNEDYSGCKDLWMKKITLKPKEIVKGADGFTDTTTSNFGLKNLVFTAYDNNNNLLAQKGLIVNLKNFVDELYLNLQTDKDLVADGDYVKLLYVVVNRSGMAFPKKDFAMTLNFAGPVEIAQNTGKLIEDISQDILPGQTVKGQGVWVTNNYENRQGGIFNVSLLLSYRDKDGNLLPLYNQVKQVQWP